MKIKTFLAAAAVAAGLATSGLSSAAVYTFQGANDVGAGISFLGSPARTISFPNLGTFDFVITNSSDGAVTGLKGNMNGGPAFNVGPVFTFGPLQTASVTGTGFFSIFDGVNTLTADVKFDEIVSIGTTVGLSFSTTINMSNVAYTGSNTGLLAVLNSIDPSLTIAATFNPGKSLTQLMKKGAENTTSYAIAFAGQPVPEPSTMALLTVGLGMVGFSLARGRRR